MLKRFRKDAPVTFFLVLANLVVYAGASLFAGNLESFFLSWGLVPGALTDGFSPGALATVFTSMFLHAGIWHLAGNMIFLAVFGRLVEQLLGGRHFASVYLIAGLGAAVAQILVDPTSLIPMVGASGAISGALGAAVTLAPRQKIWLLSPFTLFIPISMSIATFGLIYMALQLFGVFGGAATGIAFWAHIGGFAGGWIWTRRLKGAVSGAWSAPKALRKPWRGAPGEAPTVAFKTFYVTASNGETYTFYEPRTA